jgi:hypothetical protein
VLRETPSSPAARSFDIPGIASLTAFLFLLVWTLFIVGESRAAEPLLPLKLFRSVALSASTLIMTPLAA